MSSRGIPRTVALDRAIDVLSAVAQSAEPASASALARSTGQPRATVSRTLRTFADRGLVAETAGRVGDRQRAVPACAQRRSPQRSDRGCGDAAAQAPRPRRRVGPSCHRHGPHQDGDRQPARCGTPPRRRRLGRSRRSAARIVRREARPRRVEPERARNVVRRSPARSADSPNGDDALGARVGASTWSGAAAGPRSSTSWRRASCPSRRRSATAPAASSRASASAVRRSRLGAARRRQLIPFVLEAATEVEQALDPVASRVER